MDSIRKWFYRPKRDDTSLLAQFFYADESLNGVACELDSFDGRQEPERCTSLVNQLRHCQDKVLTICNQIMDELIPECRANRDFRVKFPDDVMQENLAGQLWFGAECLAAGSSILNREAESSAMRPLAKALTKSLEIVRNLLREHALKGHMNLKAQNPLEPSAEKLIESLKIFDRLFADFELCYVGAMVPVKSTKEYEQQELVCVLFSETLQRALERGLLNQADVDNYEPALMFTIPRLAIVAGLLAPPGGPLCLNSVDNISEMFLPFRTLLLKIRELLWTLNNRELYMLEKLLCSIDEPSSSMSQNSQSACQEIPDLEEFVHNFYTGYPNCKDFISDFYTVTRNNGNNMDEVANDALVILDQENRSNRHHHKHNKMVDQAQQTQEPETSQDVPDCKQGDLLSKLESEGSSESTENLNGEKNFLNPDISQILGDLENIEIPQSQYLLNQVSHDDADSARAEPVQIQNSLPDIDSKKLITEANKTLSNLLLDAECRENSEHTDSGICTVISSENTSLYDKSPEEKKQTTFEESQENTSYSCSNLNSPKRKDSTNSDNGCVCSTKSSRYPRKSSLDACHFGLSRSGDEIVGMAYGSGQIPVCSGNQPTFQINYSDNWDNLNLNIDPASSSKQEFWGENLKCKNCPSTSKKSCEERLKRKPRRVHERDAKPYHLPASTESSRSNSTDRCLNPRLVNFGSSLHPSHNTRQMPNFGAYSPRLSPRMQHFERRAANNSHHHHHRHHHHHHHHHQQQHQQQTKKLLDHRRSRSEHLQRMKRREHAKKKYHIKAGGELINDGFGPRTNKSGIVHNATSTTANHHYQTDYTINQQKTARAKTNLRVKGFNAPAANSSCSSCYDSSSETSEFHSDCQDDEEIALAMQAAEIANRDEIRSKFSSTEDLVHRLFVCIAGVADQLQTNFASDLRNILKCVFLMNSSQPTIEDLKTEEEPSSPNELDAPTTSDEFHQEDAVAEDEEINEPLEVSSSPLTERGEECVERAPVWIPDNDAPRCMACQAGFTVVRRRHHCRNCGKVFCGRCSSNNVPLPRFGHTKPVRVCNRCFLYQVTPFTVSTR